MKTNWMCKCEYLILYLWFNTGLLQNSCRGEGRSSPPDKCVSSVCACVHDGGWNRRWAGEVICIKSLITRRVNQPCSLSVAELRGGLGHTGKMNLRWRVIGEISDGEIMEKTSRRQGEIGASRQREEIHGANLMYYHNRSDVQHLTLYAGFKIRKASFCSQIMLNDAICEITPVK